MTTIIQGVTTVAPDDMDLEEQLQYVERQKEKYKNLKSLEITVEGNYVGLRSFTPRIPFDRIRRITGYLVGTMDKWNDGKRAEEKDRVKHGIE